MFAIAFCLLIACAGLYQIAVSVIPLTWRSVDCVVRECQLMDKPGRESPFYAAVLFEFEWQGNMYRSHDLGVDGWKKADRAITFQRSLERKQFSSKAYLPTGDPNHAVLLRPDPRWGGIAFVLFGVSFSWVIIMADRYRYAPPQTLSRKTIPAVALMFGGTGIFLLTSLSLPSWIDYARIQGWKEVPATVIWSRLRANQHDRKTTYKPDICYEYAHDGRTWRNNRLSPGVVSIHSNAASALSAQYPAGMKTTCRVHPTDPAQSYLITDLSWQILFTLFPLPFLFVGYLCLRSLWKKS